MQADRHFDNIDRSLRAALARLTRGISPYALAAACIDWSVHDLRSPGVQLDVAARLMESARRIGLYCASQIAGRPTEPPFDTDGGSAWQQDPAWSQAPLDLMRQWHLALTDAAMLAATTPRWTRNICAACFSTTG